MLGKLKVKKKYLVCALLLVILIPNFSMASAQSKDIDILEFIDNQSKITVKGDDGIHIYHRSMDENNNVIFVENELRARICCPDYEMDSKTESRIITEYVYVENPSSPGGGSWVPVKVRITVCYYCGAEKSRQYLD
ncbi:hypothetical protein [Brassicibacter mesophilus]|uniref:hypothetical protein n=1 Tax=Brassicibacter mesophilus TaxID=745119 RepID=UPI003D214884